MIATVLVYNFDLSQGVNRTPVKPLMALANKNAHIFQINVMRNGVPETLTGAGCSATFVRADDVSVPLDGTIDGSTASVTLTDACYRVPGKFKLTINLSATEITSAIFIGDGSVMLTSTDTIVDEEEIIPSIEDVIAQQQAAVAATNAANQAASKANSAASAANTAAGKANTAASSANSAASAVNNATVTQVNTLDNAQSATASVAVQNGAWRFTFGLPRGLTGPAGGTGNTVSMTADELESKSASELAALYTSGARWLQVKNEDTVVCLALNGDGSTESQSTNMPRKNLLDNPDFSNAVNQRKATSIIGGVYGIDRWQGVSSITNVAITSAYLQFAIPAESSYNMIWQKFELGTFAGKTLTLAACDANGKWYAGTAVFPESGNAQTVLSASNGIFLSFDARYGCDGVRIGVSYLATSPIRIQKAMMIEGSYSAKMLPPFVSPNFEEELEKCQYFFIPPGNSNFGTMQVTQSGYTMMLIASRPMRAIPSIVSGDTSLGAYINSQWAELDATLGSVNVAGNNIFLQGRTTTWPATSSLSNNDIVLVKNLPGLSADY